MSKQIILNTNKNYFKGIQRYKTRWFPVNYNIKWFSSSQHRSSESEEIGIRADTFQLISPHTKDSSKMMSGFIVSGGW